MIAYIPQNFFIAHWFVDQPSEAWRQQTGVPNMNWIAAVWRRMDGFYEAKQRFAYFDKRERCIKSNWHSFTIRGGTPRERLIVPFDGIAQMTSIRHGGAFWERVDLNLPGDQAIEILMQKSWMRIVGTEAEMN